MRERKALMRGYAFLLSVFLVMLGASRMPPG
jgi:hypothetical protein